MYFGLVVGTISVIGSSLLNILIIHVYFGIFKDKRKCEVGESSRTKLKKSVKFLRVHEHKGAPRNQDGILNFTENQVWNFTEVRTNTWLPGVRDDFNDECAEMTRDEGC